MQLLLLPGLTSFSEPAFYLHFLLRYFIYSPLLSRRRAKALALSPAIRFFFNYYFLLCYLCRCRYTTGYVIG